MSTVYVPHVIESVEQAEKLPIGTVATFTSSVLTTAAVKNAGPLPGWWSGDERVPVGPRWTALVPVEAEEEVQHLWSNGRGRDDSGLLIPVPPENAGRPGVFTERRIVTPWEPAPDTTT